MYFLNSQMLYLMPVAAILAGLLVFVNWRRRQALHRAFGQWDLLSQTSQPLPGSRYFARAALAALTAALLLFALARPIVPNGDKTIAEGTFDVLAVVDVSRSMAALDYEGKVPPTAVAKQLIEPEHLLTNQGRPIPQKGKAGIDNDAGTRLEMVRHMLLDSVIKQLDGNQLGVVSYAGSAFPQAFLTRDAAALKWVVDRGLTISSAPGEGSGMAKALELALAMFDADSPADHERLLVLFSDGGNDDKPEQLAAFASEAKKRGIKVVVVAMGNVMPSKIPVSKLASDDDAAIALKDNGKRWLETDGQIEKSGMNASLLQNLANQAGGKFIHLENASDLNLLDQVGKTSMARVPGSVELFPWALGGALVCLVLTFAATNQWRRRKQS
ncbi:MAG: VWA domain-containing protein [Candidatus Melainabacteria bacterium]|nr:VWA domain-containing protein [Candidatus Melainabacteria bacterium]